MRTFALMVGLLAVTSLAHADDDPEPPGGSSAALRKLAGTWNSVRVISNGMERDYALTTYTFEKDKVINTLGKGKISRTLTLKFDKKRSDVIEMTQENAKVPMRFFFKIEKGELYLVPDRSNDPKVKPDFNGKTVPVIVLKKGK